MPGPGIGCARHYVGFSELHTPCSFRVLINVHLSRVRFNQVQYNRKDIEETVVVPARDRLIVDTYPNHYQEIDVFNWQEAVADRITVSELELELAASEGLVRRAIERGEVLPDHSVALGERVYQYICRERYCE
jgi:hypothetical protein